VGGGGVKGKSGANHDGGAVFGTTEITDFQIGNGGVCERKENSPKKVKENLKQKGLQTH